MSDEKTLVVVDDSNEFRQSTVWLLEACGYAVHDFESPVEALWHLERTHCVTPWCLLLDVRMPSMDGLELHDALHRRRIRIPVIYMTGHADVPLAVEAMRKGAVTFLEKPFDFGTLEKALTIAFEAQAERSTEEDSTRLASFRSCLELLTPRETEVMRSIADGKANKVSAADLGISIKTVEVHRARLMKKLGVRSGPELVRLATLCR